MDRNLLGEQQPLQTTLQDTNDTRMERNLLREQEPSDRNFLEKVLQTTLCPNSLKYQHYHIRDPARPSPRTLEKGFFLVVHGV